VNTSLASEPSYCKVHLGTPLSPSQWATCWKYGWDEPTNLVARIGNDFGHNLLLPVLIIVGVVVLLAIKGMSSG
jgi:hypothetical protein